MISFHRLNWRIPRNVYASLGLTLAIYTVPTASSAEVLPSCRSNAGTLSAAQQNPRFATLDEMDFTIFSHQQWDRIAESHSQDIFVQNPDMTTTTDLPPHIDGMKFIAGFIPDARVTGHPVCVSSGDWTAIVGVFEGTFSKPMPNPGAGPPLAPTGQSFRIQMATISRWRGRQMDQEILFWDNADFAKQIGLMRGEITPKGDAGPVPPSGTDEGVSQAEIDRRLHVLDDMDFVVWNNQEWNRVPESHAEDVTVVMPDGRVIRGIADHTRNMQELFVWAPDTKITKHPIMFGQGAWTVMTGEMEGTFSRPMPNPAGSEPIAPTGKRFRLQMATYSHWNSKGKMDREYLFWDTQAWMKQIGLGS